METRFAAEAWGKKVYSKQKKAQTHGTISGRNATGGSIWLILSCEDIMLKNGAKAFNSSSTCRTR
jgi:hypothetical protein